MKNKLDTVNFFPDINSGLHLIYLYILIWIYILFLSTKIKIPRWLNIIMIYDTYFKDSIQSKMLYILYGIA